MMTPASFVPFFSAGAMLVDSIIFYTSSKESFWFRKIFQIAWRFGFLFLSLQPSSQEGPASDAQFPSELAPQKGKKSIYTIIVAACIVRWLQNTMV